MDNGSKKNLVSQDLVNCLHLVTTLHPKLYHLGWVQKDGPHLLVSQCFLITFSIGQFKYTFLCGVFPLDCCDLLLRIPYKVQRNSIYMGNPASINKIKKYGHTYILMVATPRTTSTKRKIPHIHLNQCVSLFVWCAPYHQTILHILFLKQ